MKVLVTGGAGFIGSHLCDFLAASYLDVTILDNLSTGSIKNIEHLLKETTHKMKLVEGDCTNPLDVQKAIKNVDIVFHFAANPEVRLELCDPKTCFQQNIFATHVLLQQIKLLKTHTIVFASTSAVYGEPKTIPTPSSRNPETSRQHNLKKS